PASRASVQPPRRQERPDAAGASVLRPRPYGYALPSRICRCVHLPLPSPPLLSVAGRFRCCWCYAACHSVQQQ
ncbi:hypothetical protein BRN45_11690, partial [Xanthomonas oryzae pv. oryzae]